MIPIENKTAEIGQQRGVRAVPILKAPENFLAIGSKSGLQSSKT
jgi:hypothetical protein